MKVSQEIARLVTWLGYDGLFVPSARKSGTNLVIYPDWPDESHRFEVVGEEALS